MNFSTIIPFVFEEEAVESHGEDSYFVRRIDKNNLIMGVFDGCGGIGGRRYQAVNGRTGAWIGSQAAAFSADAFVMNEGISFEKDYPARLGKYIMQKLKNIKEQITDSNGIMIGGTLNKSLPTTVSIIVVKNTDDGDVLCRYMWAGDSRGFLLDKDGLCQLTEDDIDMNADDAFMNLREDGILTNVANGDREFLLHSGIIGVKNPCMLISATDGCFAYFLTPMDFENVILSTLTASNTPDEWCSMICGRIKAVTGDDYTMTIACLGFDSFYDMKNYYLDRSNYLEKNFISRQNESRLRELWEIYRASYYRYTLNMEY